MKSAAQEWRRRLGAPVKADVLLRRVFDMRYLTGEVRGHYIKVAWQRIIGDRLARRTWPGELRDGFLPVYVANSSWLHELSFLQDDLLAKINESLKQLLLFAESSGPVLVREIRLQLGRRPKVTSVEPGPTARPRFPGRPPRPLPEPAQGKRLDDIRFEAGRIEDPELRDLVMAVRRRHDL